MNYSEIKIGQKASVTKTFKDEDVRKFAEVSMDVNPIHLDDEYAKKTVFGQRIVHGILTCGLISAVLANKLPGEGTIYLAGSEIYVARAFGRHNHRRGGSRGDERRQTHHQAQHRLQKSGRQGGCLRRRDRKTRLI